MNDAERARYLEEVLRLDPRHDADAICSVRATALGLVNHGDSDTNDSDTNDSEDAAERRRRDFDHLRTLREVLLDMPAPQLQKALARGRKTREPDLGQWAKRLQQVASVREELKALRGDPGLKKRIRQYVVDFLLASPDEAARTALKRRDRVLTEDAARGARIVRKRYPGVAALMPGELSKLTGLKRERKLSRPAMAVGGFLTIWVVFQVIRVTIRIFFSD